MKNPLDSTENKVANIFRSQDFLLDEEELLKKYPNETDKLINLKKNRKRNNIESINDNTQYIRL